MISKTIVDFITLSLRHGGYMEMDRLYLQNRLLGLIGERSFVPQSIDQTIEDEKSDVLVDSLVQRAIENQKIKDLPYEKECLKAHILDFLTPPPSVLNALFAKNYSKGPKKATDYFYSLCCLNQEVKTEAIKRNIFFETKSPYGKWDMTINLSKPEKDPKEIGSKIQKSYPKCLLCLENEGYEGRKDYPSRIYHRVIRLNLKGKSYGFQYSPYAYYKEHCIVLSEKHQDMKITRDTFSNLLQLVDIFPHYFFGSNADLPIVGGSILTHDHYQGGYCTFPIEKAKEEKIFFHKDYPEITIGKVKWPMSVIRLRSQKKDSLVSFSTHILKKWKTYTNESLDILACSQKGTLHHTITPIARKRKDYYELDLVLRDNHTSLDYPDGVFHPHQKWHHIKKENIGLIEVMGRAILPPRLKTELEDVKQYLVNEKESIGKTHYHWAEELKMRYPHITKDTVNDVIETEIGHIFTHVLEDAGVFKRDEKGKQAFDAFITNL